MNPYLKRLLGEAEVIPGGTPPAETPPVVDGNPAKDATQAAEPGQAAKNTAPIQELAALWQKGDHMAVAARLMFTEASYVDFVELAFMIGREQARELGGLLDELAETQGVKPPQTPPQYADLLQRVSTADSEESIV